MQLPSFKRLLLLLPMQCLAYPLQHRPYSSSSSPYRFRPRIPSILPSFATTSSSSAPISDREFSDPSVRISLGSAFSGIRKDISRRAPLYISDWTDGLKRKRTYAAASFLYFTCLAPIVAFGGLVSSITGGQMGVVEFLLSCGASGSFYAIFSGQPMTFLGPTGLTLAFITTLFRFTQINSLPFLPMYACTGLWTALFIALTAVFNLSNLMRYCTRFTDDCFNSLLVLNFLYEAVRSLAVNFTAAGTNTLSALASLNLGLLTAGLTSAASSLPNTNMLNKKTRSRIAAFGPTLVILLTSALVAQPAVRSLGIRTLAVPSEFGLVGGRPWIVSMAALPIHVRLACALPAILLNMLFYLDQNISVRAGVRCGLKKSPAYHLDMLVLGVCVAGLSVAGLPWTCAATVQTLNHIRALSTVESHAGREVFTDIIETRTVGLIVHLAVLATVLLLPYISYIPMPVISGIFLFLGQKLTANNLFIERVGQLLDEKKLLPASSVYRTLPLQSVLRFLSLQSIMLAIIWSLKQSRSLSLFFPGGVALLMISRQMLVPRIFSAREIELLDPEDE